MTKIKEKQTKKRENERETPAKTNLAWVNILALPMFYVGSPPGLNKPL